MKRVLCKKCGLLMKPNERIQHRQECTAEEELPENKTAAKIPKTTATDSVSADDFKPQNPPLYECLKCGKNFSRKDNLGRHEKNCNGVKEMKTRVIACGKCRKTFCDYRTRLRHEKTCSNNQVCSQNIFNCCECNQVFTTVKALLEHEKRSGHNRPSSSASSFRQAKIRGNISSGDSGDDDDDNDDDDDDDDDDEGKSKVKILTCRLSIV
ncbi:hypothetical protein ACF0H5_011558 [Mactra antiquata]